MADCDSFTDKLARMQAETRAEQDRSDGQRAYGRYIDYRAGVDIADDLIRRGGGGTHAEAAASHRRNAQAQPPTMTGRIAAGELAAAAQQLEQEADRQQPQRTAAATLIAMRERLARAHADRQGEVDREWHERHREPGR